MANQTVEKTLQELAKKLVNISARNKMLYMPKLTAKSGMDLAKMIDDVQLQNAFFGKKEPAELFSQKMIAAATQAEKLAEVKSLEAREKALTALYRNNNRIQKEAGRSMLYVGYPFVIGRLAAEDFDVRAPLMLVPVILNRGVNNFTLELDTKRDVIFNSILALAHIGLQGKNQDISQSEIEEFTPNGWQKAFKEYYDRFGLDFKGDLTPIHPFTSYKKEEFPKFTRGDLNIDSVAVLGLFEVNGNAIQSDVLTMSREGLANAPLRKLLENGADILGEERSTAVEITRAEDVKENDISYIGSLDSSQEMVVKSAQETPALVVHGPPGTGKSQTIASLIADKIAHHENVLLVSEKKTALDVVYNRLGLLNRYAMLLDGSDSKEQFYESLRKMYSDESLTQDCDIEATADKIEGDFDQLRAVANKLYSVDSNFGVEPYKVYREAKRVSLNDATQSSEFVKTRSTIRNFLPELSYTELTDLKDKFKDDTFVESLVDYQKILAEHPLFSQLKSSLGTTDVLNFVSEGDQLQKQIQESKATYKNELQGDLSELDKTLATYFDAVDKFSRDLTDARQKYVDAVDEVGTKVTDFKNSGFFNKLFGKNKLVAEVDSYLEATFNKPGLAEGLNLGSFDARVAGDYLLANLDKTELPDMVTAFENDWLKNGNTIEADLLQSDNFIAQDKYADHVHTVLVDNIKYVKQLQSFDGVTTSYFDGGVTVFDDALRKINDDNRTINHQEVLNEFDELFPQTKVAGDVTHFLNKYFVAPDEQLSDQLFAGEFNFDIVTDFKRFIQVKRVYDGATSIQRQYGEALAALIKEKQTSVTDASEIIYQNYLDDYIFGFEDRNQEILGTIDSFDTVLVDIQENMNKRRAMTIEKLLAELENQFKKNVESSSVGGEIKRRIDSKRRRNVRDTLTKFREPLLAGVKIWLMTPDAVSELLPLANDLFDNIIFDEASQLYIERSLPAIVRGNKLVIAGDSKQLRPSSVGVGRFSFDEDGEDYEENAALEEESLLDLARFKLPEMTLKYHYRSRYEELVAFSNYAYYRGQLYVSPNASQSEPAIDFIKIQDGLWADRQNVPEARRVMEVLRDGLMKCKHDETFGIITFNQQQRDLIEDMLDKEVASDSEFGQILRSERERTKNGEDLSLFVKNIENVQGDERDNIIFSIGYAKNVDGRMIRSFGSLNMASGENRLNVAVTRAKLHITVVTSIDPEELDVSGLKNIGPEHLKKYLQYAKYVSAGDKEGISQVLQSMHDTGAGDGRGLTFDSPFEEQVYNALRDKGYTVDTHVGVGGYRIDMAIKQGNDYVLGIEADGRLYHSSKLARERDFHRQKYLESRGWRIHRIWSPKWWDNPQKEIQKIVDELSSLGLAAN